MAAAQYGLGMIHLDLEEFEEAQKHLQSSFATYKTVYGVKDMNTVGAHRGVAMAARLAGNLQRAKKILETAEDSLLGKAQPLHKCLKQIVNRLLSIAIICNLFCDLVTHGNIFDLRSHMVCELVLVAKMHSLNYSTSVLDTTLYEQKIKDCMEVDHKVFQLHLT